jgi:hypothetical protein
VASKTVGEAIDMSPEPIIDGAIDDNGYWYWRYGSSNERSRGVPNFR